jgi:hypothetical protein
MSHTIRLSISIPNCFGASNRVHSTSSTLQLPKRSGLFNEAGPGLEWSLDLPEIGSSVEFRAAAVGGLKTQLCY